MAATAVPDEMQALVLTSYGPPPFPLGVAARPVPKPGSGEVLVRIAASPVNPSDLSFLEGRYAFRKELPAIPGIEGCGSVVAIGGGLLARRLAGKRVACSPAAAATGMWAQYAVAPATQCFLLPKRISDDQGAMGLVNPLAAVGLMERVTVLHAKAMVSTAAAGALGQMLLRLARGRGIGVISVVRRREQAELLRSQGADHVLDSSDRNFEADLKDLCRRLDARVALDAVGGDMIERLLTALPRRGHVVIYGALAAEPARLQPADVIFADKVVEGFYVPTWLARKSLPQLVLLERRVTRLLGADLGATVRARVSLVDAPPAIAAYQQAMTGGKLLIKPNG